MDYSLKSRVRALSDPWHFIDLINFHGGTANFDPVHKELLYFIAAPQLPEKVLKMSRDQYLRRFVMMHRSGFKSTLIVLYVMWRLYRNPNIRILYNACDKGLSAAFLREITQYFEESELQDNVWNNRPHIQGVMIPIVPADKRLGRQQYDKDMYASIIAQKTIWTNEAIQVIRPDIYKEPSIQITSANKADTGMHYDLLVNDDLVNFINSDSREKAQKVFIQAADMLSVLDPPRVSKVGKFEETLGREIITTGTPYYRWDYNNYLRDNAVHLGYRTFIRNVYVNGKDSSDGYTCPSRFNDEYVIVLRKEIIQARGMKAWAAQYLLKTIDDERQVFTDATIVKLKSSSVKILPGGAAKIRIDGDEHDIRLYAALDPASSESETANHSALVVGNLLPTGDLVIVGGFKQRLTPNKLVKEAYKLWGQYGVYRAHLEIPPGLGLNLIELFNLLRPNTSRMMLVPFTPKGDKNTRIVYALDPFIGRTTPYKLYILEHLYNYLVDEVNLFDPEAKHNDDDFMDAVHILATVCPKLVSRGQRSNTPVKINKTYGGFI